MKYEMCDHFWEYLKGTKAEVNAKCTKCNQEKHFSWYEWKSLMAQSKSLGTSNFKKY